MKKNILLVVTLVGCINAFGQRHTKGVKAFELAGGISQYGQVGNAGYVHFLSRKAYLKGNVFYAMDQSQALKHNSMGLDATFLYSFTLRRNIVYLNAKGGFTFANDKLNTEGSQNNFATFKIGGVAGVEIETFLSNHFSLIVDADQRYLSGRVFGDQRYYMTVGLRYHISK